MCNSQSIIEASDCNYKHIGKLPDLYSIYFHTLYEGTQNPIW